MGKFADIVIIGGGASGLAAAIGAKSAVPYASVAIAEKLAKTGRKILATGNGRCNLSNKNLTLDFYHGSVKNVMEIIRHTPSAEDFFHSLGVMCISDIQGRMYPHSNSAATVLGALRLKIAELGVEEICGFSVNEITRNGGSFTLRSESGEIRCRKIIIAAGGYAAPSFGTDGGMLRILKNMGYKTAKIYPAVAPLRVRPENLKGLKGVRVKGKIAAVSGGKVLHEESGEIQFTENSVSGICVFNLAYLASKYEGKLTLIADLIPEMDVNSLLDYLSLVRALRRDCQLDELLTGIFVKSLAVYLVKNTLGRPLTDKISDLKNSDLNLIARRIKHFEFEISGCSAWQNAQVTSGGIHGSCVDDNLQSKLHRGIYFAGEILDVDGDCGGYNLEWAWSSGLWSGKKCAESLKMGDKHDQNK